MAPLDPIVLFFILGLTAGVLRSELRLPPAIYEGLTVLLLISIGLKGGIELAKQPFAELVGPVFSVMLMGFLLPLAAYPVLRYVGRFKRPDAASIAAHYGSVSVGTFAVAVAYLASQDISFESYMPLMVVILEVPAILVGVILARGISRETRWGKLSHEVLLGKGVVLLVGGMLIGWVAGPVGVEPIAPLFFDLFKAILALFLLEMGLIAASQISSLRRYGLFLVGFGILFPLFSAVVGGWLGLMLGMSMGGIMMLATLAASGSYIAVPAAMRLTVPEANPTLSISVSLGVTFPFNILVGIPLYLQFANMLHGSGG